MIRALYRGLVASWIVLGAGAGLVQAAAWADGLFPENRHDFGPVPRGAKVKHDFLLVNRLSEPVTIVGLRPSCGCTSGRASASVVGPGQTAVIEAQMDTRNFVGPKSTILYVTLMTASGREAETGLGVNAQILADIVLNPGAIDFGAVLRGQSPSQELTIDRINLEGWRVAPDGLGLAGAQCPARRDLAEGRRRELHADGQPQAGRPRRPGPGRDPHPEQ